MQAEATITALRSMSPARGEGEDIEALIEERVRAVEESTRAAVEKEVRERVQADELPSQLDKEAETVIGDEVRLGELERAVAEMRSELHAEQEVRRAAEDSIKVLAEANAHEISLLRSASESPTALPCDNGTGPLAPDCLSYTPEGGSSVSSQSVSPSPSRSPSRCHHSL